MSILLGLKEFDNFDILVLQCQTNSFNFALPRSTRVDNSYVDKIFMLSCVNVSVAVFAGVSGCLASLVHDAVSNPAEGNISFSFDS